MNTIVSLKKSTGKKAAFFSRIIKKYQLLTLLIPAVVYIVLFHYVPMYGIIMAFKSFQPSLGIWGSPWVGFDHFVRFFTSPQFSRIITNTLSISIYSIIAGFPIPVVLAIAINYIKNKSYKKLVQTVTYAPHFISAVVIVGMISVMFAQETGIVNIARSALGLKKVFFEGNPKMFPHLYVWSGIWQNAGWSAIIYIAALSGVDPELHEAAIMDGANKVQRIWYIDVQSIIPTMTIMLILNMGQIMSVGFEKVFLMQNPLNISASEIISTYVYKRGLIEAQYSFSAAVGLFNSVLNFILIITFNRLSKLIGSSGIW